MQLDKPSKAPIPTPPETQSLGQAVAPSQFQKALEEVLVAQGWVAGSVQLSELMETLFADRTEEG